jgi:RNA polymerase sigma-70 factor (ECF subfamily)
MPLPPLTPSDTRDRALVESIKQGVPGAWNELLRTYQDRIYAVCFRMCSNRDLAADLAQDTMVKLVQHIDKYDGRCQFFTWVYRITMNTCLSRLRGEKLRRMASLDGMNQRPGSRRGSASNDSSPFQTPDKPGSGVRAVGTAHPTGPSGDAGRELNAPERVEQEETRSAVLRAMQSLAEEHLTVLILRDAQGLDYQQIADALEISVGTVKSRIFRARAALRDILEPSS